MKKLISLISIFSIFIGGNLSVFADESTAKDLGGFTIEGIPSNKQIDPDVGYYYLKENVGEKDEFKLKLINSSKEKKVLNVEVTDAHTNANGVIDYTNKIKNHVSLENPLTSIVKASNSKVIVPAESTVETTFSIDMPKQRQKGVILGGIVVSEAKNKDNSKKNLSLGNTYSYTIGVVLTNDDKVDLNRNISVELESVAPVLYDGHKVVQANILNPNPYLFGSAKVSGKILKLNSSKIIKEEVKQNVNIAPHSVFPFQLDWQKENLKPGKYMFKGTVETKDNKWEFEKEFEITSEKARTINKESVFKVQIPIWLKYTTVITILVTAAGTIWLVIRRGRKKFE